MFIVIEGIDGCGGETQTRELVNALKGMGKDVFELSYPNAESPIGKVIYRYLKKEFDLPPDVQMALYEADMALDRDSILDALKKGKVIVANRYLFSTFAYQCSAKGVPHESVAGLAEILKLPKPDIVIYLDISPDTSLKRKFGEHSYLDRHEEDKELLSKVRESYKNLAKKGTFAKEWVIVDGESEIPKVSAEILSAVSKRF